ncbi:DUF998 domain-containing protein [Micromonospora sp. DT229]|uniref:DUF998 domain-containing protein n=1 Tax=Micromonospora sp. DT229 TaxID=3393430 RepID=UPI003CF084EE
MFSHRFGSCALLLAGPLFAVGNAVTALAWRQPPFDWRTHNISDLGHVTCGLWDPSRPRQVCSPWHPLMNGTFILTGLLIAVGLLLTWSALGGGLAVRAAQLAALAAAGGYVLVGVYPSDVDENLHVLGAALVFGAGNLAPLLAARPRRAAVPGSVCRLGLVLGLIGLAGTVLFLAQVDLGFGVGGMERVAVYPFLIWLVVLGGWWLSGRRGPSVRAEEAGGPGDGQPDQP